MSQYRVQVNVAGHGKIMQDQTAYGRLGRHGNGQKKRSGQGPPYCRAFSLVARKIVKKEFELKKERTDDNPADVLTKYLEHEKVSKHLKMMNVEIRTDRHIMAPDSDLKELGAQNDNTLALTTALKNDAKNKRRLSADRNVSEQSMGKNDNVFQLTQHSIHNVQNQWGRELCVHTMSNNKKKTIAHLYYHTM